jgi:Protein of unknown function (DUF2380)
MISELFPPRRSLITGIAALLTGSALLVFHVKAGSPPIKIAVFDFELADLSGGAGIAGDPNADTAQLNQAASDARQLLAQSGRYEIVDVSGADSDAAKEHRLWECGGCEAAIALKLGADQSFVAVVSRISRMEYVVRFQIRDARSGDVILVRESGLRMGANYSWPRGATALVRSGLLNNP